MFSFRLSIRVIFGTIFRVRNGADICVKVGVRGQFRVRVLGEVGVWIRIRIRGKSEVSIMVRLLLDRFGVNIRVMVRGRLRGRCGISFRG